MRNAKCEIGMGGRGGLGCPVFAGTRYCGRRVSLGVVFLGARRMSESDSDKRTDKTIDYQSPEPHGLLEPTPPLVRVSRAAKSLSGFAGITLFLACLSLMPDSVCLLTCLNPFIMLMGAASAMTFCTNAVALGVGIKSRWPFWVAFLGPLIAVLTWLVSSIAEISGDSSVSDEDLGMKISAACPLVLSAVSYFAAMHRFKEYSSVFNDRLLYKLAIVAQVILVVTAPAVCLLLVYYHTVKDSESAAGQSLAAVISVMSLAVLVAARRAARTVGQAALDCERDVRGRSDP